MGKRLMILVVTLTAALAGPATAQPADPSLMGWWKFDGNWLDSSGNGRSGTPAGDAAFGPGLDGQALLLDGSGDYFTVTGYKGILGGNAFSIAAWARSTSTGDVTMVNWGSSTNGQRVDFRLFEGRLRVEHGNGNLQANTTLSDGQWHHVALTVKQGATISYPDCKLYLDGKDDSRTTTDPDTFNITAVTDVTIGRRGTNTDRAFPGSLDEVRIYDRELTAAEIAVLAAHPSAYDPSPADGTMGATSPLLTWKPRETAVFRDVYLGTDPNLGPDDLVAPQSMGTAYWHAPGLEPGAMYYWRIDEIDPDGTVHPGNVWSFFYSPREAWRPKPADGEPYMDPNVTLTWMPGLTGFTRDVYFGTDRTAVAEGTGDTFKGNQLGTTYVTGALEADTRYYWRIDEVELGGTKVAGAVWTFKTVPEVPVADPGLAAWWTLDEGMGTRTVDWSGHGHNGDFVGNVQWVDGYDGTALQFNGVAGERVEMFGYEGVLGAQDRTMTAWIKTAELGDFISWGQNADTQKWIFRVQANNGNAGSIRVEVQGGRICGWTDVRDDEWHHVAAVLESAGAPTVLDVRLYLDGWPEAVSDALAIDVDTAGGRNVWIGESHHNRPFRGLIDDVRIYDRALSEEELRLVMVRFDSLRAWDPQPLQRGGVDIRSATPLTWEAGDNASEHDVFLGTDEAAVAAATAETAGIYRGRLSATSYDPPEGLAWGQTYFWRVDEVNTDSSITPGRVWTFTVADYLLVDDFESYTDEPEGLGKRIYETWMDGWVNGNGATVGYWDPPFAERTIVHGGRQAMPLDYNNVNSPWYSEAERTWDTPQDWTFNGANTLVVYFRGRPPAFLEAADSTITLSATGDDIWGTADEFRYLFKRVSGDAVILARVDSIANTWPWAKGGVMIRETLDPGSRHASVFMTPGNGVAFQRRLANSDISLNTNQTGVAAPHWVKLTRTGDTLTAQHSADGITWHDVVHATNPTADTVVMSGTIYIGLALTSQIRDVVGTAQFSGIQMTGNVTGQWQQAEIGMDHPDNSPESLYVAVADNSDNLAVVVHPDPAATTLSDWQQWAIDLATLQAAGVRVNRVEKLYIGVGDRDNAQPGGAGRMYIDDIRLTKGVPVEPNTAVAP